jgi:hypothetical protein
MNEGYQESTWGVDQYLYNLLFDFEKDSAEGKIYNCVLNDIEQKNGQFFVKPHASVKGEKKEHVAGIHCYGVFDKDKQEPYRFIHYHRDAFIEYMIDKIEQKVKFSTLKKDE